MEQAAAASAESPGTPVVRTASQVIVDFLERNGVSLVFGLCGTHILDVFGELAGARGVRVLVPKHENNAAFMADMVGRLTGRPGVVLVTAGPGATNSLTGVAQASGSLSPVLHVSGTVPRYSGPDEFHGARDPDFLLRIFDGVTKWCESAASVDELPTLLSRAFERSMSGRPGPVHLEIPRDVMQAAPCRVPTGARAARPASEAPAGLVRKAASLLRGAKRPVLLADLGVAAERATGALMRVAESLGAPVVLMGDAWGSVPEDHPLAAGYASGYLRDGFTRRVLQLADGVLALGFASRERVRSALDAVGCPARAFPLTYEGQGDRLWPNRAFLEALGRELDGPARQPDDAFAKLLEQRRATLAAWRDDLLREHAQSRPIHFGVALARLQARLDPDAIVLRGIGNHGQWVLALSRSQSVESRFPAGIWGSMGWELPGAIAAKLVHPERQVVAITGDGSLLMGTPDLGTAVEERTPVLVVVMNDSRYGMMDHILAPRFERWVGTSYRAPDFAAMARSFGAAGVRVEDPGELDAAIDEALTRLADGPVVLDVVCGSEYPLPVFSRMGAEHAAKVTPSPITRIRRLVRAPRTLARRSGLLIRRRARRIWNR
jgi:acetolactate synthase-1/2/3 large subunit